MSGPDTGQVAVEDECVDEVLQTVRAGSGVRADLAERNGYRENQNVVKVYGTRTDRYSGFDGTETRSKREVKIAEMPESVSYEVLLGLAEYHGYELEDK